MKALSHLIFGVTVVMAVCVVSGLARTEAASVLTPAASRRAAPEFALSNSQGALVKLSDFEGKVLLLDVWATWCAGCKAEMPWFIQFQRKYAKRGLMTIGVAMDDEGWKAVAPYLKTHAINYPVVLPDAGFGRDYNVTAMPVTVLIDRKGRVADWHVGIVQKGAWEREIQLLLQEK